MGVNTKGALHALNIAMNCNRMKAFVYISTGKHLTKIPESSNLLHEKFY